MFNALKIGAVCITALVLAVPASASTYWATGVDWTAGDGTSGTSGRYDKSNALGDPSDPGPIDFLSLGLSDYDGSTYSKGFADFTFGKTFKGNASGEVFEVTWGNRSGYLETAKVFVGLNGVFTDVADIVNSVGTGLQFNYTGEFDTVRILDTTRFESNSQSPRSTDGFDIDAVGVTAPVPLPPAALALGAALAGLGYVGRRRKQA